MFNLNISEENRRLLIQFKNILLVLLVVIDFVFIFMIAFFDLNYNELSFMVNFDLIICILLFIQLCFDYKKSDKGLKSFIIDNFLDIIALIPFNFIFLRYFTVFRIFRILQFLQVFRFLHIERRTFGYMKSFVQNSLLKILPIVVFCYLMFSSVILKHIDPSFSTVFDAFWFNLVSVSSVGYGDITPLTNPGKVIAMGTILMGIVFVSIFSAAMSAVYVEKHEEETRVHVKNQIGDYVEHLKNEKKVLHERIDMLEKQNRQLNEKLDVVISLLNEED